MALVLTHIKGEGANIATKIFTKVLEIIPEEGAVVEIRKREYNLKKPIPTWTEEIEHLPLPLVENIEENPQAKKQINEDITIYVVKTWVEKDSPYTLKIAYDASKDYQITRLDYRAVIDPWRPAFKNDGITSKDFGKKEEEIELLVQHLLYGSKIVFVKCIEPQIGKEVLYHIVQDSGEYKLIARTIEGKIVSPKVPRSTNIDYAFTGRDDADYLKNLAKTPPAILFHLWLVPTTFTFKKQAWETCKTIQEQAQRLMVGNINQQDLENLIWNYKAR